MASVAAVSAAAHVCGPVVVVVVAPAIEAEAALKARL